MMSSESEKYSEPETGGLLSSHSSESCAAVLDLDSPPTTTEKSSSESSGSLILYNNDNTNIHHKVTSYTSSPIIRLRSLGDKFTSLFKLLIRLFSSLRLRIPRAVGFLGALGGRSIGGAVGEGGGVKCLIFGFGRLSHNHTAMRKTTHTTDKGVTPAVHSNISKMYQGTLHAYSKTSPV